MITTAKKQQIRNVVLEKRKFFTGGDGAFANQLGIAPSVFSRFKNGDYAKTISESNWIKMALKYRVPIHHERKWNVANNYVFKQIESMIMHCKLYSQSKIIVEECGIGKTETLRTVAETNFNIFYVDCSQHKHRREFIVGIAEAIGVTTNHRKTREILEELKLKLNSITMPVVILDEFGDVSRQNILLVKELWNNTEQNCGWLIAGADGLEKNLERGISTKSVGYAELFSRFAGHVIHIEPAQGSDDYISFWTDLFTSVAQVNVKSENKHKIPELVKACMAKQRGHRKDLRTMKDLIIQNDL